MANEWGRLNELDTNKTDPADIIKGINLVIQQLNRVLNEVSQAHAELKGLDENNPQILRPLDMNRQRISNVQRSRRAHDVVTREELTELGILGNKGTVKFTGPVEFASTATVSGSSGGTSEVATIGQVVAGSTGGGTVARDGDNISIEQADGQNGTSDGTVIMGMDGERKARMLRSDSKGLRTYDSAGAEVLSEIRDLLRQVVGGNSNAN